MTNKHMKRCSTSLIIREMQIKTIMRYDLTTVRMVAIKKCTNNKCWRECGENGIPRHCQWKCKLVRPLWRTVWGFLKKLEIELPYDPVVPLLQQYMNCELPDVQAGFRKGRGTRDQSAHIHWIIEKATEFQINIYFCFIDYAKAFDYIDCNKLWKILKEIGIPDHLTCLLRNLYAGQEATLRTGHGTIDWF